MNFLCFRFRLTPGTFSVILLSIGLWSGNASAEETSAKLKVVVPIEPYRYLVESIGGEWVDVMSVVPGGADPHHYAVTGKQMKFIVAADLYFSIQLPFEMQIRDRLLHSSEATVVNLVAVEGDKTADASHEHRDDHGQMERDEDDHEHHRGHDHGGHDPHVWTDPVQVLEQVGVILAKLAELDPPHAEVFQENAAKLTDELRGLNEKFETLFHETSADHLLVYHPAWGHFCERYGLHQVSLEREGKAVTAKAYAELLRSLDASYFPVILVQPQMSDRLSRQVSLQVGFEVVVVDPLAYNYRKTLELIYQNLSGSEQSLSN